MRYAIHVGTHETNLGEVRGIANAYAALLPVTVAQISKAKQAFDAHLTANNPVSGLKVAIEHVAIGTIWQDVLEIECFGRKYQLRVEVSFKKEGDGSKDYFGHAYFEVQADEEWQKIEGDRFIDKLGNVSKTIDGMAEQEPDKALFDFAIEELLKDEESRAISSE